LLKLTQLNGSHAELFSYFTYVKYLSKSVDDDELVPFTKSDYITATDTSESPTIVLSTNTHLHPQGPSLRVVTNRLEKGSFFLRITVATEREFVQLAGLQGFFHDEVNGFTLEKIIQYTAIRREIKRIAVMLQPIV
jgi:spore coat polysaccharide biosynthesis protein SpsF (cytidylyltransferase family)